MTGRYIRPNKAGPKKGLRNKYTVPRIPRIRLHNDMLKFFMMDHQSLICIACSTSSEILMVVGSLKKCMISQSEVNPA